MFNYNMFLHYLNLRSREVIRSLILSWDFQVRIEMYPSKRKYKTKVQHVDSPRFNECFKVSRIPPEDVEQMGCRIRLDMTQYRETKVFRITSILHNSERSSNEVCFWSLIGFKKVLEITHFEWRKASLNL